MPYEPTKDFAAIGLMARIALLVVASPSSQIKSAERLIAALTKSPGQITYASPGKGSPHHLAIKLFKYETGLSAGHVPYRGAASAMGDVMSGHVPLMIADASTSMNPIKARKLIPLVTLSAKRSAQMPDVPTMAELGHKGVEAYAWQGMVVPASTPQAIQDRLSTEMQAALNHKAVRKRLADAGWEAVPSDANLFGLYVMLETRKWHKLIAQRKITLE